MSPNQISLDISNEFLLSEQKQFDRIHPVGCDLDLSKQLFFFDNFHAMALARQRMNWFWNDGKNSIHSF